MSTPQHDTHVDPVALARQVVNDADMVTAFEYGYINEGGTRTHLSDTALADLARDAFRDLRTILEDAPTEDELRGRLSGLILDTMNDPDRVRPRDPDGCRGDFLNDTSWAAAIVAGTV